MKCHAIKSVDQGDYRKNSPPTSCGRDLRRHILYSYSICSTTFINMVRKDNMIQVKSISTVFSAAIYFQPSHFSTAEYSHFLTCLTPA